MDTMKFWSVAVGVLVSGCVSNAAKSASAPGSFGGPGDPAAAFDDETGAIDGIVTDDSIRPIEGVEISLAKLGNTTFTNRDGKFGFSHVPPGPTVMVFAKAGFESQTRTVDVMAGEAVRVATSLAPIASQEPFSMTVIDQGMLGCSFDLRTPPVNGTPHSGYLGYLLTCLLVEYVAPSLSHERIVRWMNLKDSPGMWLETDWRASQASGTGMKIGWRHAGPGESERQLGNPEGKTPVRIPMPIQPMLFPNGTLNCHPKGCNIVSLHGAAADTNPGFGMSLQQKFTDYVTAFYHGPLPADFSAVPADR